MEARSERNALPVKGASFWRESGEVIFQFVIDPGNVIGPRPAMKADSEKHPEAWAAFTKGEAFSPVIGPEVLNDRDREPEPAGEPLTAVAEKDMDGFAERIEPLKAAPPRQKRKYTRKAA